MRTLLLGFVFLAGSAAQGLAAKHEWKGYSVTIEPRAVHEQDLSCTAGKLTSGGYVLDRVEGPYSKIAVIANTPFSENGWWIRFYNDHDAPMLIEFRIAILCN